MSVNHFFSLKLGDDAFGMFPSLKLGDDAFGMFPSLKLGGTLDVGCPSGPAPLLDPAPLEALLRHVDSPTIPT